MNLKFKCKNIGCKEQFVHSNQLSCHKKKCTFEKPTSTKPYIFSEKLYKCVSCPKVFTCQSNASRHAKQGCKKKLTPICKQCQKTFSYPSQLHAHMKVHEIKRKKVCETCNKYFAWEKV